MINEQRIVINEQRIIIHEQRIMINENQKYLTSRKRAEAPTGTPGERKGGKGRES